MCNEIPVKYPLKVGISTSSSSAAIVIFLSMMVVVVGNCKSYSRGNNNKLYLA